VGKLLLENIDLFDGVEFCHFYTRYFSFNKKAVLAARQHNLALVGNSDSHSLSHMGTAYSLIDAKPIVQDIINAVKQRKAEVVSTPRSTFSFFKISFGHIIHRTSKNL
jgi:predicted metal-dependent phosphoesterase TrpH